ncbi:MAG: hypothetical protein ACSLEM_02085 [Candidatus Malihini olakiniferum]
MSEGLGIIGKASENAVVIEGLIIEGLINVIQISSTQQNIGFKIE